MDRYSNERKKMKILFISDIHGKITNLKYIDDLIIKENFDKFLSSFELSKKTVFFSSLNILYT